MSEREKKQIEDIENKEEKKYKEYQNIKEKENNIDKEYKSNEEITIEAIYNLIKRKKFSIFKCQNVNQTFQK